MKQFLTLAAVCGALTTAVLAAPAKTSKPTAKVPAKSAAPQCEKCKMTLMSKADKTHTIPVKVNGKTFYCCADCGAHKETKPAKKDDKKKAAEAPNCPKCGMKMSFTKSPLKNTLMKVKGTTYYCCTICPKH